MKKRALKFWLTSDAKPARQWRATAPAPELARALVELKRQERAPEQRPKGESKQDDK